MAVEEIADVAEGQGRYIPGGRLSSTKMATRWPTTWAVAETCTKASQAVVWQTSKVRCSPRTGRSGDGRTRLAATLGAAGCVEPAPLTLPKHRMERAAARTAPGPAGERLADARLPCRG